MTFYTKNNIKAVVEGSCATLHLTDFGISKHGAISFINMCDEGDCIRIDEAFANAEASKGVFDLISPCEGVVNEINYTVLEHPDTLVENEFLIRMEITAITDSTISHEEYEAFIKTDAAKFSPAREMKF